MTRPTMSQMLALREYVRDIVARAVRTLRLAQTDLYQGAELRLSERHQDALIDYIAGLSDDDHALLASIKNTHPPVRFAPYMDLVGFTRPNRTASVETYQAAAVMLIELAQYFADNP